MCGIIGVIGKEGKNKELLKKMNDLIMHRGPDDEGFFYSENVGLAMRRLAIIDLKRGKQPITSKDGRYTIVFNGEIYNYQILKEELIQKGFIFQTDSDTEVLLNLYISKKEKMLLKLRGMFAFAIHDNKTNTVFLARDYFGIKPLYYLQENNKLLAFGSEIKSLLLYPGYQKKINDEAVYNYLSFQYNPLEETFFKDIWNLPPGHSVLVDLADGSFKKSRYWSFQFEKKQVSTEQIKNLLHSTLEDSVRIHMLADVPVGSFLSGGIDSGVIASLASRILKKDDRKLSTFTIGFKEENEWNQAGEMAQAIESDHQRIELNWEDYFKALPIITWHFDEPVADPSAVALYFLAQEARKKVKVVLSGEGADELFGGYNIYLEPFARTKLQYIPQIIRQLFLKFLMKIFPRMRGIKFLQRSLMKTEAWYIGNATLFSKQEIKSIWNGEKFHTKDFSEHYSEVTKNSDSEKMQYIDINTWLVGDILAKADKMTMANSLELRVPFLDIKISNIARALPDELKWKDGQTKYLLREVSKDIVPETTRMRKKLGFPTPVVHMIDKNYPEIKALITQNSYIKKHIDLDNLESMFREHTDYKKDNSRKIFALLMLSIWHDTYFS